MLNRIDLLLVDDQGGGGSDSIECVMRLPNPIVALLDWRIKAGMTSCYRLRDEKESGCGVVLF